MQIGDDVHEVGVGAGYWAPRGVPHTVANFSGTPATMVSVVTPGGMERLLEAQGAYLTSLDGAPPDPEAIADIGRVHQSSVAGPPLAAIRDVQS